MSTGKKPNAKFVQTNTSGGNGLMSLAKATKKPAAKKDEKEIITVDEKRDKEVSDALTTFVAKKAEIDAATAALEMASGIIKDHGKKLWIDEMTRTTRSKDSFIIANKENKSALFVVTDSYKRANLDEERIEYLKTTYGEDIIGTDNKFVINPELVEKYGQILCDFIKASKDIADEDKNELIQLEQKNVIAKGTIDKMSVIAKTAKTTVEVVFNEVQPTCQLKVRGK